MTSPADDEYRSGAYFQDPARHAGDAVFKAARFVELLRRTLPPSEISTFADVGCGSGAATIAVADGLSHAGFRVTSVLGYDVSPHVGRLEHPGVTFVHDDFASAGQVVDLVTLFDVIEHVPDPVGFLRRVAARARYVGLHIPLDDSFNAAFRNLYRRKLSDPGHLVALDTAAALNLVAHAGIRTLDFDYVLGFEAPTQRGSLQARVAYPVRAALAALSPWLLAKTLGGASLMVIGRVPRGAETLPPPVSAPHR